MKPIAAVMIHVHEWREATEWYHQVFQGSVLHNVASDDFGQLEYQGMLIEIVDADNKVTAGTAGSIVYWAVENFDVELERILNLGARLYRGPVAIEENRKMCQVVDLWGNSIGLRG